MSQRRIWNYGDTFTSERATVAMAALHSSGVYSGFDVTITDVDTFTLNPGFLLLPSGLLVEETSAIEMRIAPLPAAATNYTITVRHVDADIIGGQAATYALEPGLLTPSSIVNGIPIAYIRYPGGAVPLSSYFVTPARKVLSDASDSPQLVPSSFLPPLASHWTSVSVGPNTTVANVYSAPNVFTRIETDGLGPVPPGFETTTVVIPLIARRFRPVNIVFRSIIDANSSVLVSMRDTDGNAVTLSGSTIGPTPTFSDAVVSVNPASGVFTEGDIYMLELTFRTPALASVDIQSVSIHYDPLP